MQLSGRQTQFYVDIVYGLTFIIGFGYLLLFGMDPRVAALEAGLVVGYVLRVWENIIVYEQILEEEVAEEAEDAVAQEIEQQVPPEAQAVVADKLEAHVSDEVETQVEDEFEAEVGAELNERIEHRIQEAVDAQLAARLREIDDELASKLEARLDGGASQ